MQTERLAEPDRCCIQGGKGGWKQKLLRKRSPSKYSQASKAQAQKVGGWAKAALAWPEGKDAARAARAQVFVAAGLLLVGELTPLYLSLPEDAGLGLGASGVGALGAATAVTTLGLGTPHAPLFVLALDSCGLSLTDVVACSGGVSAARGRLALGPAPALRRGGHGGGTAVTFARHRRVDRNTAAAAGTAGGQGARGPRRVSLPAITVSLSAGYILAL